MTDAAEKELAERARKLFAGPIEFLKSAPELQFLPDPTAPEIAFAGRSNVGKSSLLNALTNRHGLKEVDREMMAMLDDAAVGYHIVLTKGDKVKASALGAIYEATMIEAAKHPAAHPAIFTTSSETGSGIAELRTAVLDAALI